MPRESLFDWLVAKEEKKASQRSASDLSESLPWRMSDPRPIFRLAVTGALARNAGPQTQRTILSRIDERECGGLVYPTKLFNASYAFMKADQIIHDNGNISNLAKINTSEVDAYEWDLDLQYIMAVDEGRQTPQALLKAAKFTPRVRPQFASALPLPSHRQEWRCIASGTTQQALTSLSDALASGQPPLVLITGPPGSGKEAYAAALHYGRGENWDETNAKVKPGASDGYATIPLAALDVNSLDAKLCRTLLQLKSAPGSAATLFFDEADKADEKLRGYLLQLLESRVYQSLKGEKIDCNTISFIVGAGQRLGNLREEKPPDFWTRMEVHIEVHDPLLVPSEKERRSLLAIFFRHFWWDVVSHWLEGVLGVPPNQEWEAFFKKHPNADYIAQAVFKTAIGSVDNGKLTPSPEAKKLSECFGEILSPHLERRELSVRGLRSCVKGIGWELGNSLLALAFDRRDAIVNQFESAARTAVARSVGTILQVLPN